MDRSATDQPPVPMWGDLPIPVLALTMCAFCIGTAEFVVMGLLPDIARDLAVSIPLAGQLVTAYALGVVVGAPILAALTARQPRKRVLLMMVGIFIVGNFLSAIAPNYLLLVAARVLAAFAHGTLFGVGAVVAADMVPANRQARAIGLMFLGLTLANILGVPLGTLVGQSFGWRATFGLITVLGVVALVPVYLLVPEIRDASRRAGMRGELSVLARGGRAAGDRDDRAHRRQHLHALHLHRAAAAGRDRLHPERRDADPVHDRHRRSRSASPSAAGSPTAARCGR